MIRLKELPAIVYLTQGNFILPAIMVDRIYIVLRLLGALVFGVLAWMGQVGPDEAATNYARWWVNWFDGTSPALLLHPAVETWLPRGFLILAIVFFVWFIWPLIKPKPKGKSQNTVIELQTRAHSAAPNWTIRELFYHVCPDLEQRQLDNTIDRVGIEIGDKLATGQLRSWGRIETSDGSRSLLIEIDKEYWKYAEFTYLFLGTDENSRYLPHAVPRAGCKLMGIAQYRDIQVNKEQALQIWSEVGIGFEHRAEIEFDAAFERAAFERNKESRAAAILRLAQLRSEGVVIRNDAVAGQVRDDNFELWQRKVSKWMHEVIDVIWKIDEADSEWFKTLDIVPTARVQAPISFKSTEHIPDFVSMYNQHDFRLLRLDDLLKKYRGP